MRYDKIYETIVKLFAKIMYYGDWKWDTPNERVITMLMQEVGMLGFKNEDEMIAKTKIDENLYKEAAQIIPSMPIKNISKTKNMPIKNSVQDVVEPIETKFSKELSSLLNRYSKENNSNTPDFLLAIFLISCLDAFNSTVNAREKWYGRDEKENEKTQEIINKLKY